jgi:hypothetical protein
MFVTRSLHGAKDRGHADTGRLLDRHETFVGRDLLAFGGEDPVEERPADAGRAAAIEPTA